MADELNFEPLNTAVKESAADAKNKLQAEISRLNIGQKGLLLKSIRSKVGYDFGQASKVAFSFSRYGVFVAKGVGRSYKIDSVGANTDALGKAKKGRTPKDWYNPVVKDYIAHLADIVVKHHADLSVKGILIK